MIYPKQSTRYFPAPTPHCGAGKARCFSLFEKNFHGASFRFAMALEGACGEAGPAWRGGG